MPVPLEPGDRKLLIIAGGILAVSLLLAVPFGSSPVQGTLGYPSSYSAASDGAKAAYLLLGDLGYEVRRWDKAPDELPNDSAGATLVLAAPFPLWTSEDGVAVRQFLRRGGRVLATGALAASLLPGGKAAGFEPEAAGWQQFSAGVPSVLARGAPQITMSPDARWGNDAPEQVAVYAQGKNAVVVTYAYGKGRVIWWASDVPLTNGGISLPGNLELFLNSVGPRANARVLWDEYYHGRHGTLWGYLKSTPFPWGLAQLGVLMLALLATFGRRSGPVRPPAAESRLSPLEFVETLGDLYHRAHAASTAVATAYHRFCYLLRRRLSLRPDAGITRLYEGARDRLGWKQPGLYEILRRAERASRDPDLSDAEALQLVEALEEYSGWLQLRPQNREGNRAWRNR